LAISLDKRHNGRRVVDTRAISQLLALVVQDAHLHRLVVVVQTHKYCYSTHDSLLLLKRNLTPAGGLAPAGATSFHPHLGGGQVEGILENLTSKMNHEEHQGTRRCPIELLRVPSCLFVVQKTYAIESAAMNSTILSAASDPSGSGKSGTTNCGSS